MRNKKKDNCRPLQICLTSSSSEDIKTSGLDYFLSVSTTHLTQIKNKQGLLSKRLEDTIKVTDLST